MGTSDSSSQNAEPAGTQQLRWEAILNPIGEWSLPGAVDPRFVFTDLQASTLEGGVTEMAHRLAGAGAVRDPAGLARRLLERERLGCTGLGSGVAIPHCKLGEVKDIVLAIGTSQAGIDFHAADGVPVRLIFLILSPGDKPALHLQALARISRLLRTPGVVESLRRASTVSEILEAFREAQASFSVASG